MKYVFVYSALLILLIVGIRVFNTFDAYLGLGIVVVAIGSTIYLTYNLIPKNSKQNEENP